MDTIYVKAGVVVQSRNTLFKTLLIIMVIMVLSGCGKSETSEQKISDVAASESMDQTGTEEREESMETTEEPEEQDFEEALSETAEAESESSSGRIQTPVKIPDLSAAGNTLFNLIGQNTDAQSEGTGILEGWELLDSAELDFNEDGIPDYVGVLDNFSQEEGSFYPRILFAIESTEQDGYRLSFQDANLIRTRSEGGVFGDPYLPMTAEGTSFTTNSYGGSAWRWGESKTYTYQEGTWYLTFSEEFYGYDDFTTSEEINNWETGVGIRRKRSDDFDEMEKYWEGEKEGYDIEYEIALEEPLTLYQAGMRWWLSTDRRTDWEVTSVKIAEDVEISEDQVVYPSQGFGGYHDEDGIFYGFSAPDSRTSYLARYSFEDHSLSVLAESEGAIDYLDLEYYKGKIYYTTDIFEEVTYRTKREESGLIKEEQMVGFTLNRMNADGTEKEEIFEYRYPGAEQEIMEFEPPYLALNYEISRDEIIIEVYVGSGEPHPFYRMNVDGSGQRQIGQVPR